MYRFLLLLFLFSCGEASEEAPSQFVKEPEKPAPAEVLNNYKQFLELQKDSALHTSSAAIEKLKKDFTGQPPHMVDSAIHYFIVFQDSMLKKMEDGFLSHPAMMDIATNLVFHADSLPQEQQQFLDSLKRNGFTIAVAEGSGYIVRDWSFILKAAGSISTPAMKDYLDQMNKAQKVPLAKDAAIVIKPEEMVDRLMLWERFNYRHSDFIYKKSAVERHQFLLQVLFRGMDNTPIFTNDGKPNQFYLAAYNHLLSNYANTTSANELQPFIEAVQSGNRQKAAQVLREKLRPDNPRP